MNERIKLLAQKAKFECSKLEDSPSVKNINDQLFQCLLNDQYTINSIQYTFAEDTKNLPEDDLNTIKGASEGLIKILLGQNLERLGDLTFREWESFLRDDNNQPVFEGIPLWEEWFENIKETLFISALYSTAPVFTFYPGNWVQDDLIDKTEYACECLKESLKNVRECLNIEIILLTIEGPDLILELKKKGSAQKIGGQMKSNILKFLIDYFSLGTGMKDINIVAQ
tara:strand:+ start:431977 stop:432654 length:678 start_codon:yes stop_codon:yes gene_type:complete